MTKKFHNEKSATQQGADYWTLQPGFGQGGKARWFALLVIAIAGMALCWVVLASAKKPALMESGVPKSVLHLEPFVLNLADPGQKAYLRIGVDVGLDHVPASGEKSAATVSLLRDTMIDVLSRADPDELLSREGKAQLKSSLVQALQLRAPGLEVREVYFTEFLIQR
ncbi:MAG TPA: flagellar basal body-associated FliL family protein [Terriglobales bacterium]